MLTRKRRRNGEEDPALQEVMTKDEEMGGSMKSGDVEDNGGPEGSEGSSAMEVVAGDVVHTTSAVGAASAVSALTFACATIISDEASSTQVVSPTGPSKSTSVVPMFAGVPSSPPSKLSKSAYSDLEAESVSNDSSSSAGASGWSSSAGFSSLNTASFDAGTEDGFLPGTLGNAAIGTASVVTQLLTTTQGGAK